MRLSIIVILISISAIAYGQQDTTTLDTIDLNPQSKVVLKQITEQLDQLQQQLDQLQQAQRDMQEKLIILLTGAGIDPKKVAGFTPDYKILSRK